MKRLVDTTVVFMLLDEKVPPLKVFLAFRSERETQRIRYFETSELLETALHPVHTAAAAEKTLPFLVT